VSEKVAAGFPACRFSGFQPQVGWRTGGKMPPSLATKMVAATFSDSLVGAFSRFHGEGIKKAAAVAGDRFAFMGRILFHAGTVTLTG
jgi:hypothetical protein